MDNPFVQKFDNIITQTLNKANPDNRASPIQFAFIMLLIILIGVASVFVIKYIELPYVPIDRDNDSDNHSIGDTKKELRAVFRDYRSGIEDNNFSLFLNSITEEYLDFEFRTKDIEINANTFQDFTLTFLNVTPILNEVVIDLESINNLRTIWQVSQLGNSSNTGIVDFRKIDGKWKVNTEYWS